MTQSVAYGMHAVRVLLERSPQRVRRILLAQGKEAGRHAELRALAQQASVEVSDADAALLEKLSDGGRHQGVVAEVTPRPGDPETQLEEALEAAGESPLLLVLDGVQDPHIAPRDRAAGLTPVARKVAAGAAELVPFIPVVNLARTLRELKDRNVWMVGTDDGAAKTVYESRLTGPIGIVMGSEGDGMRRLTRETCDELVSIPMAGAVESLNVSVATGIVLFEAVRQRRELARRRPR